MTIRYGEHFFHIKYSRCAESNVALYILNSRFSVDKNLLKLVRPVVDRSLFDPYECSKIIKCDDETR